MRIISGKYKGSIIEGFDIEGTRPTMDRVKESLFSMVQDYVSDSVSLDLFSGSGNLGLEALSNGSKMCYFVDNNKKATDTIKKNITKLKIDNYSLLNMDYKDALNKLKDIKFDLVFLDPPYKNNCYEEIINYLMNNNMINDKGLIICEYEFDFNNNYEGLKIYKERDYGNKKIIIFKKI